MTRILIVDDDQNNRLVLSDCLEDDYSLVEAENGEQALEMAKNSQPDLILLDVQMPIMDGHEALRRLKSDEATNDIPVIMVTALDMDSQVAMFLNDGAVDHIGKPFSTLVVRARVKAALRRKIPQSTQETNSSRPGRIFSFIGAKGGVGTTTVALNVATLLASRHTSVIAAEFHPYYGTFGQQLNILPTDNLASLVSESSQEISADGVEKLLVRHKSGVQVLLGPQITEGFIELTPDHADSIVGILRSQAQNVVMDLPSRPSESVQTVLRQSDFVCLVLERDAASLRSARVMLDLLHSRGVSGSNIGAIVVNRAPTTSGINIARIQKDLPCRMIGVVPPEPELCEKASDEGVPIVTLRPNSEWAHSLSQLTDRLCEDHIPALAF